MELPIAVKEGITHWCERKELPIAVKLHVHVIPIMVAGVMRGKEWVKQKVKFLCDNESVVAVMKLTTSRNPHVMHLLRSLFFTEAQNNFECSCKHIPGKCNDLVDDLSCNRA